MIILEINIGCLLSSQDKRHTIQMHYPKHVTVMTHELGRLCALSVNVQDHWTVFKVVARCLKWGKKNRSLSLVAHILRLR